MQTRIPVYIWIMIGLLVGLNIASLVGFWWTKPPQKVVTSHMPPHHPPPHGGPFQRIGYELGFTEEQHQQFDSLLANHEPKIRSIDRQLRQAKTELFTAAEAPETDISELLDRIASLHRQKDANTISFLQHVRTLCDEEQQEIFDALMEQVAQHGPGGPHPPPPPPHHMH